MKTEELFFIVRIVVQTEHENINDTLQEMKNNPVSIPADFVRSL